MTPNKDKWIIELIFQMYADGISIPGIVDQLNEKGAKTLRKKADFKYSKQPYIYPIFVRSVQ